MLHETEHYHLPEADSLVVAQMRQLSLDYLVGMRSLDVPYGREGGFPSKGKRPTMPDSIEDELARVEGAYSSEGAPDPTKPSWPTGGTSTQESICKDA